MRHTYSFLYSDLSSGLRPAPSRSGKHKEGPFMGRLRANFARLGNPMQDCHLRKEPALRDCLPALRVILSRRRRISVRAAYETNAVKYRSERKSCSMLTFESYVMSSTSVNQLRTVSQLKGRPFYGQAKGQLWLTRRPYAGSSQWLSPLWCLTAPPSPRCAVGLWMLDNVPHSAIEKSR